MLSSQQFSSSHSSYPSVPLAQRQVSGHHRSPQHHVAQVRSPPARFLPLTRPLSALPAVPYSVAQQQRPFQGEAHHEEGGPTTARSTNAHSSLPSHHGFSAEQLRMDHSELDELHQATDMYERLRQKYEHLRDATAHIATATAHARGVPAYSHHDPSAESVASEHPLPVPLYTTHDMHVPLQEGHHQQVYAHHLQHAHEISSEDDEVARFWPATEHDHHSFRQTDYPLISEQRHRSPQYADRRPDAERRELHATYDSLVEQIYQQLSMLLREEAPANYGFLLSVLRTLRTLILEDCQPCLNSLQQVLTGHDACRDSFSVHSPDRQHRSPMPYADGRDTATGGSAGPQQRYRDQYRSQTSPDLVEYSDGARQPMLATQHSDRNDHAADHSGHRRSQQSHSSCDSWELTASELEDEPHYDADSPPPHAYLLLRSDTDSPPSHAYQLLRSDADEPVQPAFGESSPVYQRLPTPDGEPSHSYHSMHAAASDLPSSDPHLSPRSNDRLLPSAEECESNRGAHSPLLPPLAYHHSSSDETDDEEACVRPSSATADILLPAVRALEDDDDEEELVHLFAADHSSGRSEHFRSDAMDQSKLAVLFEQHREHIAVNELVVNATGVFVDGLRTQPEGALFRRHHLAKIEDYIRAALTAHWGEWDASFGTTLHHLLQRYENLETDLKDELLQDLSNVLYDEMVFSTVQRSSVEDQMPAHELENERWAHLTPLPATPDCTATPTALQGSPQQVNSPRPLSHQSSSSLTVADTYAQRFDDLLRAWAEQRQQVSEVADEEAYFENEDRFQCALDTLGDRMEADLKRLPSPETVGLAPMLDDIEELLRGNLTLTNHLLTTILTSPVYMASSPPPPQP
mmetsp:Transcript_51469/g.129133  ORF Transcript_51469/g.129133 Transcript_51469/m.129133 type:complete len:862 (+) Transcript_51469:161-2746(+)|eukprot:CAMPEP_0174239070 /NCGR_PEP_ID=MMETSP0417-20130205/13375_1 /TAXON_ID=242541 /ORGANISM="Mayorella sp, Strain BSH-02190019" /LENGTH=861 /DNA_ID=CAMNT_0015317979 /DNA_START=100 /DNA_END=2685 /DNA_ORIENTATION=+